MNHSMIKNAQNKMYPEFVNAFKPRKIQGGSAYGTLLSDLCYGKIYPNSYVDIYQTKVDPGSSHPVVIYCHGGGYTWGDKAEGDPNAEEKGFYCFDELLKAGYQIVSVNYALAPEYQYPVPLLQLNACVDWLLDHQEDYLLDMDQVIFMGGSAGAHLAGQFVNVVTNAAYAKKLGITSKLQPDQVRAFVSQSGLLDCERFDKTGSVAFDYILRCCGRAYFEVKRLRGVEKVIESNVIENMTSAFPPCFISDGNEGTFTDQAQDLAKKAGQLSVPYVLKLYPRSEAKLGHGFEGGDTPQAREVRRMTLDFLKSL